MKQFLSHYSNLKDSRCTIYVNGSCRNFMSVCLFNRVTFLYILVTSDFCPCCVSVWVCVCCCLKWCWWDVWLFICMNLPVVCIPACWYLLFTGKMVFQGVKRDKDVDMQSKGTRLWHSVAELFSFSFLRRQLPHVFLVVVCLFSSFFFCLSENLHVKPFNEKKTSMQNEVEKHTKSPCYNMHHFLYGQYFNKKDLIVCISLVLFLEEIKSLYHIFCYMLNSFP